MSALLPLRPPFLPAIHSIAATTNTPAARSVYSRLPPAVVGGAFELPDPWCGAPIRGEDGKYHLFASRVPKSVIFHPHWLFMSDAEVALPPRGGDFFDARNTHNPHIRKVGDTFLLLYMGANYDGPTPTPQQPEVWRSPRYLATWTRKRIGLAGGPGRARCGLWRDGE